MTKLDTYQCQHHILSPKPSPAILSTKIWCFCSYFNLVSRYNPPSGNGSDVSIFPAIGRHLRRYAYVHVSTCIYMWICVDTRRYACFRVCTCIYLCFRVCTCIYACFRVSTRIYAWIRVYVIIFLRSDG